jgi:hypothetical protein
MSGKREATDCFWKLVTAFNKWGEGTTVEPALEDGMAYLDVLAEKR